MTATLSGIGVGQTAVVAEILRVVASVDLPKWGYSNLDMEAESEILVLAVRRVEQDLKALAKETQGETSEIFEALAVMVADSELMGPATVHLEDGWTAAAAYGKAVDDFCAIFSDDAPFQERASDLNDLSKRVQAAIAGLDMKLNLPQHGKFILVAEDFSPSETARFGANVVGVITERGGPTSHTSIICRALGIPALVGASEAKTLVSGASVLLDPVGNRAVVGGVIEDATPAPTFTPIREEPTIKVRANVGSVAEAVLASGTSAEGIGLLRTELLYLSRNSEPTLDEQVSDYTAIFRESPEGPITVRTLDPEGDKKVPFLPLTAVAVVRNYRVLEEQPRFLEMQLRAIAEAGKQTGREIWVMAPQIGSAEEAEKFVAIAKKFEFAKVGVMVEVPSLIEEIPKLSGELDFISVGTNDLAQNMFGINRMNSENSELLDPWQPEFLSALAQIATAGQAANLSVGVCGEVAANPEFAIKLAELGYDSVSVAPSAVHSVTLALRS